LRTATSHCRSAQHATPECFAAYFYVITRANIAISGLSCSGKTTHARLLAVTFGYDYVSASSQLLQDLGLPTGRDSWRRNQIEIDALRSSDDADRALDARIVALAQRDEPAVFDSWALPYIYDGDRPLLRVRLESSLKARAIRLRMAVSRTEPGLSQEDAEAELESKDAAAGTRLLRMYSADVTTISDRFGIVIDSGQFVSVPTRQAARNGIALLHRLLCHQVDNWLDEATEPVDHRALSGAAVIDENGSLLLVHRRTNERTQWELPGGHVGPNESPSQAAERRLHAETGITGQVVERLGDTSFLEDSIRYSYTWFRVAITEKGSPREETVHDGWQYFSFAQLDAMRARAELSVNAEHLVDAVVSGSVTLAELGGTK